MISAILVGINVIAFVVLELLPRDIFAWLYGAGAMYWPAVMESGQYYRLLTSMFLHADSTHLVNNMLILFLIGSRLEKVVGKVRFLVVYFLSGILAGVVSMGYNMWQERLVLAVGASGAVFGLVGALVWVVIAHRGRVQDLTVRQMMLFTALSLYGGFADYQTDNAAHLGGLVVGFLLMMLLYRRGRYTRNSAPSVEFSASSQPPCS